MVEGPLARTPGRRATDATFRTMIGLLYGIGAIALPPVLIGDLAAYEHALGATAGMTLLAVGLGVVLGLVSVVPLSRIVSPSATLAGAALLAAVCGLICWALPSGSFPNAVLIPRGLYAAAAPVILVAPAAGRSPRGSGLLGTGSALTAMIAGVAIAILLLEPTSLTATALLITSIGLLVIAVALALRAPRMRWRQVATTA